MATFPRSFGADSARIHRDHQALVGELNTLDGALDELAGGTGVFANLHSAETICRCGQRLAEVLPEHFSREETTLLETVAQISPELAEFTREIRQQHEELRQRVAEFSRALKELEAGSEKAIDAVREAGKALAREMTRHIALEENQLGGFL